MGKKNWKIDDDYDDDYDVFMIEKINIKKIDWDEISDNWIVSYRKDGFSEEEEIELNPYKDCSPENPLYRHKEWLKYLSSNLGLDDSEIGEICGLHGATIHKWRKIHNIPARAKMNRWINSNGYIELLMPPEYRPPYINYLEYGKVRRLEHIVKIENIIKKNPRLSKEYLIDGKYLKPECEVHHINLVRTDNQAENLWAYRDKSDHSRCKRSLYDCLSGLIKIGQIYFERGKYYIKSEFDYRCLEKFYIKNKIKPMEFIDYEDLDDVRTELKKINWDDVSNNWTIHSRIFGERNKRETFYLNPYEGCSPENPLYKHEQWVHRLVYDKRFNMTDKRLGELCGISEQTAYRWRWEAHGIEKKNILGGKYRTLKKRKSGRDYIYIKLPEGYNNPFARKLRHFEVMVEHRYVMEKFIAQNPEWEIHKILLDGKYLNPDSIVHHINFDTLDNRIENLWVCNSHSEHNSVHRSLLNLVKSLLEHGLIYFENGLYNLVL